MRALWRPVLGAACVLALAACSPFLKGPQSTATQSASSSESGKATSMVYWDGSLPLEQRQSIQAFQRDEEPKILEFRRRLAEAGGGGVWEARSFGSAINKETDQSSGHEQPAWELVGQDVAGPYVPVPEVERIGREVLSETYSDYELGSDKGGVRQLSWSDPVNGGFLYVTVHEGKVTLMRYQTGLRPSDGTTENPRDFITGRVDIDIPEE
ncbi:hypothetical protein HMPREF1627_01390 [Actinomyces sp. S6-Spd3]|nr:hypothetical protein HMPREF1627_01390 [Actinomyces sp. S6-Spd3]